MHTSSTHRVCPLFRPWEADKARLAVHKELNVSAVRWPRNCEYARLTTETKARTGHHKLARVVALINNPEALKLAGEVMVDLFDIGRLMADAKHGDEGTFERANNETASIRSADRF